MSCPICGGSSLRPLKAKNSYAMARCLACRHLFATRAPSEAELADYYARYCYEAAGLERVPPFIFKRLTEVVAGFRSYRNTNRFLDVGFGAGAMLRVAKEAGWDVYGIEFSGLAVEQAWKNGFTNATHGDFLRAPYEPESFDVIVGIELLEHLPDPLPFIRQAARLLAPGGLFYSTTPNGAGLSGSMLGVDWSVCAPPEHLHLFSPESVREALILSGFGRVRVACEGINPFEILHHYRGKFRLQKA